MMKNTVAAAVLVVVVACQPEQLEPTQGQAFQLADAERVHAASLVLDAHADVELPDHLSSYVGPDGRSRVEPAKLHLGGVGAVVLTAAVGPQPRTSAGYAAARARANQELEAVMAMAAEPSNRVRIARSASEVREIATVGPGEEGRVALILGVQNALMFGQDPGAVDRFHGAGVRVFALTHMGHNDFADSSRPLFNAATGEHEPPSEHDGLSPLGVAAIERINALGGIVDISQLSTSAALEAIEVSSTPVIASHSNVRALCDVSRNLSDEEIDRIGATGGVIHVTPFRGYLYDSTDQELDARIRSARRKSRLPEDFLYPFELYWELEPEAGKVFAAEISELLGPGSIDAMLDHLDYVVARIGVDHVGIGTDFNHGGGVDGYQDASESGNVTLKLLERGYSEAEVAKIWGGNFLRVFELAKPN